MPKVEMINCPEAGEFEAEFCLKKTINSAGVCYRKGCAVGNEVRAKSGLPPLEATSPPRKPYRPPDDPDQVPEPKKCARCKKVLSRKDAFAENALVRTPKEPLCSPCYQHYCVDVLTARLKKTSGLKRAFIDQELKSLLGRMKAAEGRANARLEKKGKSASEAS